jgi:Na+-translocating ferredoxin:NAD+ oxidoreductase RnfC subunit
MNYIQKDEVELNLLRCTDCGVMQIAACNCGSDYRALSKLEAAEHAALKFPGMSSAAIAEKIGVGLRTVERAMHSRSRQPGGLRQHDEHVKAFRAAEKERIKAERERVKEAKRLEHWHKLQEDMAKHDEKWKKFKAEGGPSESFDGLLNRWLRSGDSKPALTIDEFKLMARCLHPDVQPTVEQKTNAMAILNAKKFQLTGIR